MERVQSASEAVSGFCSLLRKLSSKTVSSSTSARSKSAKMPNTASRMTDLPLLVVFSMYQFIVFLLVLSARGRYNNCTGLPVVVGGYGSLCLALDGGGTEGFSIAFRRAITQLAIWMAPATAAITPIMLRRSGARWFLW